MKNKIKQLIIAGAEKAFEKGLLNSDQFPEMEIEEPRHEGHGDLSTNFAMVSASVQRMAPKKIAQILEASIDDTDGIVEKIQIAGPGFINFFLTKAAWLPVLEKIHDKDEHYGASEIGRGRKVQVEFVSANPTGPLHIGHGRGAAVGDSVGNILSFCGYEVQKEYYINDSGRQIRTLGRSVWLRLSELQGQDVDFPDDCYQGDYIKDFASELDAEMGDMLARKEEAKAVDICAKFAAEKILREIKEDLSDFGVHFDRWFSEQNLYDSGKVKDVINKFQSQGIIYEKDGALWFKTEEFGDEKDRVVVRQNGLTTYFASDIAYHMEKFDRGFDRVIDVWGADHHGYINRINAAIDASSAVFCPSDGSRDQHDAALNDSRKKSDRFDVILVQLVNLLRDGEPVAMSTRAGEFVTLKNIVDEVGADAARFIFLSRSYDSGLDFDLELAKRKTSENPVYYVQYVHARISGILIKANDQGLIFKDDGVLYSHISMLDTPEDIKLLKILASFPEAIEKSCQTLHPHVIFTYLMALASAFHGYYNKHKVITDNESLSLGRLCLVSAVKKVIRNGLALLGVSAPERM